jgi:threonine dehydrogenase-like Zn-dependent dehydrogenase
LIPSLALAPLISHRFPFDRAAEAYALVDQRPAEVVQVVLTYGDV